MNIFVVFILLRRGFKANYQWIILGLNSTVAKRFLPLSLAL